MEERKTLRWYLENKVIEDDYMLVSGWSGKVLWKSWNHPPQNRNPKDGLLDCDVFRFITAIRVRKAETFYTERYARGYLLITINGYDYEHKKNK